MLVGNDPVREQRRGGGGLLARRGGDLQELVVVEQVQGVGEAVFEVEQDCGVVTRGGGDALWEGVAVEAGVDCGAGCFVVFGLVV